MYEKTLFFDSHENYRTGGTRDHPTYALNEEIYANSLYLKRCSFFNSLKNVSGNFQLDYFIEANDAAGNAPLNRYFATTDVEIESIGDINSQKITMALNSMPNFDNDVVFVWADNFRNTIGNLGIITNLTGGGAPAIKYINVSLFLTPVNNNWKPIQEFLSFMGKEDLLTNAAIAVGHVEFYRLVDRQLVFDLENDNDDFSEEYSENITTNLILDYFQPRYLFLHSNLHAQFVCKNQLKIGDRNTYTKNDVIAVIPINAGYGTRVDWTELQTMGMDKALDINTISDLNNAEFWFTTRSVNGEEEKVSFEGRTFQITIQYITNQYR